MSFSQAKKAVADYFEFSRHSTTFKTEVIAGVSTFLALSNIFVVNPAILSEAGIDKSAVLFATIVVSSILTIVMGLWAKTPFALAPGLEINAYVAFFVVGALGFSWQAALCAVFWSGVIFLALTISGMREKIINAIPNEIKTGLAACVGVFLALISLKLAGILLYDGIHLSAVGNLFTPAAAIFALGLITVFALDRMNVRGAVLLSIIFSTVAAHALGLGVSGGEPVAISSEMLGAVFQLDFGIILNPRIWSVILLLFLVDFYGSIAKLIGLTRQTSIVGKDGKLPRMKEALLVDGMGAVGGPVLGTTSVLTYVESGVGIGEGGRTGLVSVVCGVLMALFLVLTPLVNLVPLIATTGALLFVGMKIMPGFRELAKRPAESALIAVMAATVVLTFALDKAMLVGLALEAARKVASGKVRELNPYLVGSIILLAIGIFLGSM